MRYFKTSLLITVVFLWSCGSTPPGDKIDNNSIIASPAEKNIFSDFKLLNAPRENINIGSEWVNGFGPNNTGSIKGRFD